MTVPTDPAFLLDGWAVVVFLALVLILGVPTAFVRGWIHPASTLEAERRRGDMLQEALTNGRQAERNKDEAIIEMLQLARTSATILERLQDARDEALAGRARERVVPGGTTTTEGARS